MTEATGPNSKGCPEYDPSAAEGSGVADEAVVKEPQEIVEEPEKEDEKTEFVILLFWLHIELFLCYYTFINCRLCEVTNKKTGVKVNVSCSLGNGTIEDAELFENITAADATLHCSKSKYGCCPDWVTPAEGKNNEGCPKYILGCSLVVFLDVHLSVFFGDIYYV